MRDTPVHTAGGGLWFLSSPAGREIVVGQVFVPATRKEGRSVHRNVDRNDENGGYRVTLKFANSSSWNSLSVEAARSVVRTVREQSVPNADAIALAAAIERWADCCERLNAGWASMGRPSGGFDSQVHGNA